MWNAVNCDEQIQYVYVPESVSVCNFVGEQPFPCLASYGASKAALNLFINTLRHELKPWGVKVSIILPSAFKTGNIKFSFLKLVPCKLLLQTI